MTSNAKKPAPRIREAGSMAPMGVDEFARCMDVMGWTDAHLARELGATGFMVSQVRHGRRRLSLEWASTLRAKALAVRSYSWPTGHPFES